MERAIKPGFLFGLFQLFFSRVPSLQSRFMPQATETFGLFLEAIDKPESTVGRT